MGFPADRFAMGDIHLQVFRTTSTRRFICLPSGSSEPSGLSLRDGLATASHEIVIASRRRITITRLRITDAGRRAMAAA
jgi:hypothetical protein